MLNFQANKVYLKDRKTEQFQVIMICYLDMSSWANMPDDTAFICLQNPTAQNAALKFYLESFILNTK